MSHQIIEIVGPPGIGKTTIYESLCKIWRPTSNWTYQDALLSPKPHFLAFKRWFEYQVRKVLRKKISKSIPVEYGLRFGDEHQDLANFYWNHLSDPGVYNNKEISKRFRSAYFLYADFCRYQAIFESRNSKPCIVNEGLLQKSFLIQDDEHLMLDVINKYVALLPLPHAVIYINTPDKDVILERLRSRKKVIASHLGKDNKELLVDIDKWQYLLSAIIRILESNGVSVYNIDGEKPVEENVLRINEIFNKERIYNPVVVAQKAVGITD